MKNEVAPNDLKRLWQSQKGELVEMTLDELRTRTQKYGRKIYRRNAIEYVGLASVVAFFGFVIWDFPDPLTRVGSALIISAALYMSQQLYRRGSARTQPEDRALMTWLEFHRLELQRQRDLLSRSWRWYLGPPIPGLAVLFVALGNLNPGHLTHPWRVVAAYSVFSAAAFLWVRRIHVRCARNLQRQIDELDALEAKV